MWQLSSDAQGRSWLVVFVVPHTGGTVWPCWLADRPMVVQIVWWGQFLESLLSTGMARWALMGKMVWSIRRFNRYLPLQTMEKIRTYNTVTVLGWKPVTKSINNGIHNLLDENVSDLRFALDKYPWNIPKNFTLDHTKWNAKESVKNLTLRGQFTWAEKGANSLWQHLNDSLLPAKNWIRLSEGGNSLPHCIPVDSPEDPVHSETRAHKAGLAVTARLFTRS